MNHNTYKKKKLTDVTLSLEVDNEKNEQIKTVEFETTIEETDEDDPELKPKVVSKGKEIIDEDYMKGIVLNQKRIHLKHVHYPDYKKKVKTTAEWPETIKFDFRHIKGFEMGKSFIALEDSEKEYTYQLFSCIKFG
jgi:hypothetical protein